MTGSDATNFIAEVFVTLKPVVNDPEGIEITNGLHILGFDEVDKVRSGKYLQLSLTAADASQAQERVEQMCEKLLANTVIEEYSVKIRSSETVI